MDQAADVLRRAKTLLIALPKSPSSDAIASSLALFSVLEKLGKEAKVVAEEFQLPPNHAFLPKSREILPGLESLQKFIISIDVSKTKVEELSYALEGNALKVYLTPKDGFFTAKDVATSAGGFAYDLIVTIDAIDLEHLGGLFANNAEFFYQTPILNIDHSPANNHFGQVNLVDIAATSTSEIMFELIKTLDEKLLDEFIATHLLTGIISKTKSFKTPSVTPKTLTIASHLVESGGRREEIIKNLYQTKSLETLKLWGRALARLQGSLGGRFVRAKLNRQDFEIAAADSPDRAGGQGREEQLSGVIDELIINTPKADCILLLYEDTDGTVRGVVSSKRFISNRELFAKYHPEGTGDFTHLTIPATQLDEAERQLTELVERHLQEIAH